MVATDAILCTDGAAAFARFSKKSILDHHVRSNKQGKRVAQKAFHIQNVKALHFRYNDFKGPFKGPASKYLERYLRWFLLRSKMDGGAVF